MTLNKTYIDSQQLLDDAYSLALRVLDSAFRPDYIVGVWRGGAPVGIAIQELLSYCGIDTDHIAIRTSLYTGIGTTAATVKVHGLHYLVDNLRRDDKVLIVDDVFDTGRSIAQVMADLKARCGAGIGEIRIATPYYKPANNKTDRTPDFYLHETADWLVFPHELNGLSVDEILKNKPGISAIRHKLEQLKAGANPA
jgi:hypoxanthine phosphoribosyltransferase